MLAIIKAKNINPIIASREDELLPDILYYLHLLELFVSNLIDSKQLFIKVVDEKFFNLISAHNKDKLLLITQFEPFDLAAV